jgi:hypothetical protein
MIAVPPTFKQHFFKTLPDLNFSVQLALLLLGRKQYSGMVHPLITKLILSFMRLFE